MQVKAIVGAYLEIVKDGNESAYPDIVLPFVTNKHELEYLLLIIKKAIVDQHDCTDTPYLESCLMFNIGAVINTPSTFTIENALQTL